MRPQVYRWLSEFTRRNTLIAILVALVAAVTAVWAFMNVQTTVKEARRNFLANVLATQTEMVKGWIAERQADARQWAHDPDVAALVAGLAGRHRLPAASAESRRLQAEFRTRLAPALEDRNLAVTNIVGEDGVLIASMIPEYVGRRLAPAYWQQLQPAYRGESVFIGPVFEHERLEGAGIAHADTALVWTAAPVRDAEGRIVAVLCLGRHASARFAGMLEITRPGGTGEAYAFDAAGRMVSGSRFEERLRSLGLLAAGQPSLGRVMLRVPEREQGIRSGVSNPTRLMAEAQRAGASEQGDRQGILLEPYANYLGEPVIGAWQWLGEHRLGLAVEISEAEAYKPIRILNTHLLVMVMTLTVAVFLGPALPGVLWRRVVPVKRGQVVGDYLLDSKIGEGGMADIFLGTHVRLGRRAAIKVVKGGLRENLLHRFEREARLLASLRHPDIAAVYEIGYVEDGRPYYAMEYFEGEPLDRIVAREGPLDERLACRVLMRVCGILQHAYDHGVVHRDTKPENILLSRDAQGTPNVKLTDFGLAKSLDPADHDTLTQEVSLLGTLGYLSPERIRDPADIDVRGEVYAVGALGYFLLTGEELVPDLENGNRREAPPVGARRTLATPGLEAVIAKALHHPRQERWADCRELSAALAACLHGASSAGA